ncbi:MAG: lytic murein transglycosylase B [Legionellales bacterium]|nr:lytic murein transglycosylase B [Legionellales bacterium]|tara:strand:- start:46090 stop:47241 length:1152 start_codon:yes stop_codon:yes gene_type:complete
MLNNWKLKLITAVITASCVTGVSVAASDASKSKSSASTKASKSTTPKTTAQKSTAAKPRTSQQKDVQGFINRMVKKYDFDKKELETLFDKVIIKHPKVVKSISSPSEALPWYRYEEIFMTPQRVNNGAKFWQEHAKTLDWAYKKYGVPPNIIIAILGVETLYGEKQGNYRVIDALSTLAFNYSPRSKFFTKELEQYLLLTRENKLDPLAMKGSYAGAFGAPQFMPSSYRSYAVDYSGNGRKDLQNDVDDAIASIANYLAKNGWHRDMPIGAQAKVKGDNYDKVPAPPKKLRKYKPYYNLAQLSQYGITPIHTYPKTYEAIFMELNNGDRPSQYWLGFHNFYVITSYNPSVNYAMAVYQLSRKLTKAHNQLVVEATKAKADKTA